MHLRAIDPIAPAAAPIYASTATSSAHSILYLPPPTPYSTVISRYPLTRNIPHHISLRPPYRYPSLSDTYLSIVTTGGYSASQRRQPKRFRNQRSQQDALLQGQESRLSHTGAHIAELYQWLFDNSRYTSFTNK